MSGRVFSPTLPLPHTVMPGLGPGISSSQVRRTLGKHMDGRNKSGHDGVGGAVHMDRNFSNMTLVRP